MPGGTNSRGGSGPIRFNGWLDRVQKEAQESEMDHTNTSPAFFWLLALIQLPLVQILSHLLQLPWLTAGNQAAWGLPAQILGYDYDKVAWMAIVSAL